MLHKLVMVGAARRAGREVVGKESRLAGGSEGGSGAEYLWTSLEGARGSKAARSRDASAVAGS